jgi:hypothetical protein
LYAVGETDFALKVADAQVAFIRGADGQVSGLEFRQQGFATQAPRIDAVTAQQLAARLAARIENKTPVPGSEAALRRLIEDVRAGTPNYDAMSPAFAYVMQRQLPRLQPMSSFLGDIRSIEFQGVGSQGWDRWPL